MKSVIEKLAEIEATAQAIVEHAEIRKRDVEKEVMLMSSATHACPKVWNIGNIISCHMNNHHSQFIGFKFLISTPRFH